MARANHIACGPGDIGRYVLMPGDPARCQLIAGRLGSPELVAQNREFTTYTGLLSGQRVSVTSTGIGCPSTVIAIEELASIGADTFIRVGTCGGMQPDLSLGSLVIATAAVREEGTSRQYIPLAYPAVADISVVNALREAGKGASVDVHEGIVHSKDSFFGQQEYDRMPIAETLQSRWRAWIRGGVLCSEMEAAALFVVASVLKKRAGGIMMLTGNQERSEADLAQDEKTGYSLEPLLDVAIEGVKLMIQADLNSAQRQEKKVLQ